MEIFLKKIKNFIPAEEPYLCGVVVNRARAFRVGFGPSSGLDFKNFSPSIGPAAGVKSRFSVSDRVFAMAGIKQRERLVAYIGLRKRG